jgi:hypothetical protein
MRAVMPAKQSSREWLGGGASVKVYHRFSVAIANGRFQDTRQDVAHNGHRYFNRRMFGLYFRRIVIGTASEDHLEDWRAKALEIFPDLQDLVEEESGPIDLWIELHYRLVRAYDQQPINEDLIGRIYDYAAWCLAQPSTDVAETDPSSAAAVGLIENLPCDQNISNDLYRWMSTETFDGCEALFRYMISDDEYQLFAADFRRRKKGYDGPSRL